MGSPLYGINPLMFSLAIDMQFFYNTYVLAILLVVTLMWGSTLNAHLGLPRNLDVTICLIFAPLIFISFCICGIVFLEVWKSIKLVLSILSDNRFTLNHSSNNCNSLFIMLINKPFHSSSFRYRLTYIDRYVINSGCVMRTGYFYPNQSRRLKM